MIHLKDENVEQVLLPLLMKNQLEHHPIIGGVMSGKQLGGIYVDCKENPNFAVVYAIHEMIYFIGDPNEITSWFKQTILPIAEESLETDINIEIFSYRNSHAVEYLPAFPIKKGTRVKFTFSIDAFNQRNGLLGLPGGYVSEVINKDTLIKDKENVIVSEISRFWHSTEEFFQSGVGTVVFYEEKVVGTCLSVYRFNNVVEIGINTYDPAHRGKGIATEMADLFIEECLARGYQPNWTTENFRKDSIAIARKLGFVNEQYYTSYYFLLEELKKADHL
jgi:GNAT superfamily N-acetyltransferase